MSKKNHPFWDRLFGGSEGDERKQKVREYIVHRVSAGAHLRDVLHEEYVQRNASRAEIDDILEDPRLVEATHEQMKEDFSSERLKPMPPPSSAQ